MARLSPITVGVLVVMSLVLGAAVYVVSRSNHHVDTTPVPNQTDEWRAPPPPEHLPVVGTPKRVPRPAVSPPAPPRQLAIPAPAAVVAPPSAVTISSILQKRALLNAAHHQELTQKADERVFEILQMSEAQRVAIRQINEDFGKRARELVNAAPGMLAEQRPESFAKNTDADRARRAALENLLGVDAARAFDTNEHTAARILLRRYRPEWGRELRDQALVPEGLSASPP